MYEGFSSQEFYAILGKSKKLKVEILSEDVS